MCKTIDKIGQILSFFRPTTYIYYVMHNSCTIIYTVTPVGNIYFSINSVFGSLGTTAKACKSAV